MDDLRELLNNAARCGGSGDLAGCRAALIAALPLLSPQPATTDDPQRAIDQCQAAAFAVRAGDTDLAREFATALLEQVAGPLRASGPETLLLANLYARAFVPLVTANPWLDGRSWTGLAGVLAQVARDVRPELDAAGWSTWSYPEALATRARDLAARAAVDLGRAVLDGSRDAAVAADARALAAVGLDILRGRDQDRSSALIMSDADNLIGRALQSAGDLNSVGDEVLAAFAASLAIQQRFGAPSDIAVDQSNLAVANLEIARFDKAQAEAEEARARHAEAEGKATVAAAALAGARAARRRAGEKLRRALGLLAAARAFHRSNPSKTAIDCLVNGAAVHAELGDLIAARADLLEARAMAADLKQDPTRVLFQLGQVERQAGDMPAAERALKAALAGRQWLPPDDRVLLLGAYGAVLRDLGRAAEALPVLESAHGELEASRRRGHLSRVNLGLFKRFRWVLEALIACRLDLDGPGHAARAFEVAEGLRWPTLVGAARYLPMAWRGPPDARLDEEQRLLRLTAAAGLGSPGQAVDPAVGEAFARLDQIWDELAPLDPDYVAIRRQNPVPANRVGEFLDETVGTLVAYYLGEEIDTLAVAWVFRRGEADPRMFRLPHGAKALAAMVENLRAATDDKTPPEAFEAAAARLHAALIAPITADLTTAGGICFVPFGPLHNVPFGALFDGVRHLVEDRPVVVAPSVAALRRRRRQGAGRPAGHSLIIAATGGARVGGQVGADLSLFANLARQKLMRLLPGPVLRTRDQATRPNVLAALASGAAGQPWGLVHIACHGLFETLRPDGTLAAPGLGARLVLTGPDDSPDRDLTALEIATQVRVPGALVVLSARESGVAAVATNDDLFGLAHAFVYAGASSVLGTLWYLVQQHGVELTRGFYAWILDPEKPVSLVEAFQLTQIETMHRNKHGFLDRPVHPYVWAAFQLMGDWR